MREFKIDYTVRLDKLTRSVSKTDTDLKPYVDSFISELYAKCAQIPPLDYSVEWGELSSSVLASTRTQYLLDDNVWVSSNSFNIVFNPRFQWWNGTCSSKPSGHYDLESTVMHEVLHGLGYMSTISEDKTAWPSKFDLLLRDSAGFLSVVGGNYLGNFGDQVYIDHVRMYNPPLYNGGSSFSHENNGDRLMSHSQTTCHRHLGRDILIVLNHLGYQCSLNSTRVIPPFVPEQSSSALFYIGGAIVVIVLLVVVIVKSKTGRKKRALIKHPLLESFRDNI